MSAKSAIHIEILGSFEVRNAAGEPVELRSKKCQALLAYLALTPGKPHGREQLATLLWGEMPEDRARQNLRQCISSLKKALGPAKDLLATEGEGVVLAVSVTVDAIAFLRLASQQTVTAWAQANVLYRGDFLSGFSLNEEAFETWLEVERRRFSRMAGELFMRLGQARADAGDVEGAEAAFNRRLDLDPCTEEAHRALIQLYASGGRRSEALRQYEYCREVLSREFNTTPAPETTKAYQSARGGSSSTKPDASFQPTLPLPAKPSIAVLPFENFSGDPEQRYFSDGIAEDIIVALSKFESLMVISRASTFTFRQRIVDPRKVAIALGVHYILQGSVRRAAETVRVSAQLIDAASSANVWAHAYDRSMQEIFSVQDELVQMIVATLVGRVERHSAERARKKPTANLEAYDYLLKGKYYHHLYSDEDNQRAEKCLARAIELDSDFALAYAWMGCVLGQSNTFRPDSSVFDRAYTFVSRARDLSDDDSECHRILAAYYLMRRRFEDAQRHQQRALTLNPNDDRIVAQMGEVLTYLGNAEEAIDWLERAMRLNPYHADNYWYDYGRALFDAGKVDRAYAALNRISNHRLGHCVYLAACCVQLDRPEDATIYLKQARGMRAGFSVEAFCRTLPYQDQQIATRLATTIGRLG